MKKTETVLAIPEVELKPMFWLDHYYLGGVDYRFGWNTGGSHWYTVVFRGDESTGKRPVRGPIKKGII